MWFFFKANIQAENTTISPLTSQRYTLISKNNSRHSDSRSASSCSSESPQQQTYPPCLSHFHLCLSSRDCAQTLSWNLSERSFNGDKTSVSKQLTVVSLSLSVAALCFLRLHILASRLLSRSPSWRVGFILRRGCALWRHLLLCVCVRGCVSGFMCLCRMKCRLPPLYASLEQTHLHSRRGWLLCKRRRHRGSPEWIRSGLSLFHFTAQVL